MQKISEGNKSSPKSLDMKNIMLALIFVILILSLLVNFLTLGKLSKIPGNLHAQGWQPVWGSSDGIISEQELEPFLQINPALDKIRHLQQQIIDREVIKDDSLIGVPMDDQLKEDIKEYNKLVPKLKGFFAEQAIRTLILLSELKNKDGELYAPDYLDLPSDIREYAEIITDLSLYRNCTELLCNDSRLAFIIYAEAGGSAGMWPYFWHTEYLRDRDDIKGDLNHLYDLVERIITSLDKEYENILYKVGAAVPHT
ncbi:MAG TPA: hypothetical protein GXX20_05280 [Clostridiaceae bacterium]|nr:hypothetical protein [Clostridiaceae bacterium]